MLDDLVHEELDLESVRHAPELHHLLDGGLDLASVEIAHLGVRRGKEGEGRES